MLICMCFNLLPFMFRKYWYFTGGASAGGANTTLAAAVVVEEENRHDQWKNERQMEDDVGGGVAFIRAALAPSLLSLGLAPAGSSLGGLTA